MKYRKKPVVIEAHQFDGANAYPIKDWISNSGGEAAVHVSMVDENQFSVVIDTLEGGMVATAGDYIIRGVQGEFYPVKPDIFEQTYEPVPRV